MVDRKDVASWLEGPRASRPSDSSTYPGQRLGLPRAGSGAVGRFGRRAVALLIDWSLCQVIAMGLLGYRWGDTGGASFLPLAVFFVENVLLVGTLGATFGHRLVGLQVVLVAGRTAPGPVAALLRSFLLCLAIPALIWDRDERGMHDRAAGTVILRR